jgi:hypothetical protein
MKRWAGTGLVAWQQEYRSSLLFCTGVGVHVQPQFKTKVKTSCSTFTAKDCLGFQQKFPLKSLLDLI